MYVYFITQKGKEKWKKNKPAPGDSIWHVFRSSRALWALRKQGISGGTAKHLSGWVEPMDVGATERALDGLVAKGFARRRKLT